jgi:hypothetical protein
MVVTTPNRTTDPPAPRYLRAPVPLRFPVDELVPETHRGVPEAGAERARAERASGKLRP